MSRRFRGASCGSKSKAKTVVFNAIRPRGSGANSREVQDGYRIAQQNCFRCHNSGDQGGTKAQRPWTVLATWATASPEYFAAYIHDPKSKNPKSKMEGFPNYDAATLAALTKYFQTFTEDTKERKAVILRIAKDTARLRDRAATTRSSSSTTRPITTRIFSSSATC